MTTTTSPADEEPDEPIIDPAVQEAIAKAAPDLTPLDAFAREAAEALDITALKSAQKAVSSALPPAIVVGPAPGPLAEWAEKQRAHWAEVAGKLPTPPEVPSYAFETHGRLEDTINDTLEIIDQLQENAGVQPAARDETVNKLVLTMARQADALEATRALHEAQGRSSARWRWVMFGVAVATLLTAGAGVVVTLAVSG